MVTGGVVPGTPLPSGAMTGGEDGDRRGGTRYPGTVRSGGRGQP